MRTELLKVLQRELYAFQTRIGRPVVAVIDNFEAEEEDLGL